MSNTKTKASISSWAVPTEDDDRLWDSLTRDEQVAVLREHLTSPDCTTPTNTSVADIVKRTRAATGAKRGGHGQ